MEHTTLVRSDNGAATQLYGTDEEVARFAIIARKVAPWANDKNYSMTDAEVGLAVRKAIAMGVDPLNGHEVQIWKDNRGVLRCQLAYTLIIEWVRYKGWGHTEPQYFLLDDAQKREEGIPESDVAYRVKFIMKDDLQYLAALSDALGSAAAAIDSLSVTGIGTASRQEWNSQYFAPAARGKAWKVKKRALTDAYRCKFGTPSKSDIIEMRRDIGEIAADDWDAAIEQAPPDISVDDMRKLAQAHADPMVGAGDADDAADVLFGSSVTVDAPPPAQEPPATNDDGDTEDTSVQLNPHSWTTFTASVMKRWARYDNVPHVTNALRSEKGDSTWNPWDAWSNDQAATCWTMIQEHEAKRKELSAPFEE